MEKLTNVKALEMVLSFEEVKANAELVEKLEKMKAQFEKKNKGDKTLTAEQKKNEVLKTRLIEILAQYEVPKQIKQLTLENTELSEYSNQKLSALLNQLVKSGKVLKVDDKRTTKFILA